MLLGYEARLVFKHVVRIQMLFDYRSFKHRASPAAFYHLPYFFAVVVPMGCVVASGHLHTCRFERALLSALGDSSIPLRNGSCRLQEA
jgi:hypothetical protein